MDSFKAAYEEAHTLSFEDCANHCPLHECGHYFQKCPQKGKLIVTNAFSDSMVNIKEYTTRVTKISEEIFKAFARNAKSHVSHMGIANRYNLKLNRERITLLPGDELVVCYIRGGILPDSGVLPDDVELTFAHILIGVEVNL